MAHDSDLPCDGDGRCMICKTNPPEEEKITCKTCVTPWHVDCLSTRPETLADAAQWECPDCSNLMSSDAPPCSSVASGSEPSAALVAAIRAIESDASLSDVEKAKRRQKLLSGGGSDGGDEQMEEKKEIDGGGGSSSGGNDVLKLLSGSFNCSFCMQLPERPVTTPCGHNFCLKCFEKWVGQGKRTCAICRTAIPSKMASNPRINSSLVIAIRMAKMTRSNAASGPPKPYYSVLNQNKPDKAYTTERAKKTGKANACSGKIFVTVPPDHFGPISAENDPERGMGVLVGETWEDRLECRQWGAHLPHVAGICGQSDYGAQSVALSGGYEDDEDHGEWFLYTGSGGRDLSGNKRTNKTQSFDQKFDKSNEALRVSCRKGYPVRVVRSHKEKRSAYAPETGVRYDGVYRIEKCWRKPGIQGFKVCRYLFVRCDNDPAPWTSDEIGDRPRPLPTIKELKEATDVTERTTPPSWDYDFIPLPAVAGFYLARFFTKKNLSSYFAFFVLGSLMVTWFVWHNFWDLNIWLAGMSLRSFCKLIVADVIFAMAVPGLALLPQKLHYLTEVGLIGHALLLCYIENRFYTYSGIYYYSFDDEVMYPSYMVVLTTFVGLALVRRLSVDHRVGPKAVWLLTCLYSSKLTLLFMTSKAGLWASAILLLAVSPPLLLYKDRSRTASKMKPWQGYSHAAVFALSVWFCRETIFEALQWWNGRSPSGGLLLGFCILLTGLACVPIVALHFSHVMSAKRGLVLVIATGLLFIVMQPPVPSSWTYHSELIKAARQSSDDISIYGFITSKPTWPSWLLISAILLSLSAFTSIIPIQYIVELRMVFSIAMGIALGVYISAEYFLQATVLHILIITTMVCTSVFVVFTHLPSASSTKVLPWVFALLVALFPVTYLLEGQVRVQAILAESGIDTMSEEDSKLTALLAVEGARTSLLGLYAAIFMLIALEIKFELASLMREKVNERGGGLKHSQSGQSTNSLANFPPKMRFMQQRRVSTVPAFTIKRMAAEGAWMPAVGNVATIMCFAICLILNVNLTGGSNRAIFLLAPILLLLNQDSDFVAGFGDKQRYFPVTVVISGYMALTSLYIIWEETWQGNVGWGMQIGGADWFFAAKNLVLLILTFPSHIMFNQFVWSYRKRNDSMPLLTIPLNLASSIVTDVVKIRILGLLGIIYSLTQYLISRQQYMSGLKYI